MISVHAGDDGAGGGSRGSVAIICPFAGPLEEGERVLDRLSAVARREGDLVLVVDNTRDNILSALDERLGKRVRVVSAPGSASSYYARNVGAESADAEWLLFLDADCIPVESILDEYFAEPIPGDCGALAGAVVGASFQEGLLSRYARVRGVLDQARLTQEERPHAATANLLVRRSAWESIGGFCEGIRSGGDVDFCWRLQDAGWKLGFRSAALIEHVHRETLRGLVRQFARYGAGRAWLRRRHPDTPRPSMHVKLFLGGPILIVALLLTGRVERAAYRGIDVLLAAANLTGRLLDNRSGAGADRKAAGEQAILTASFPRPGPIALGRQLRLEGGEPLVEADARAQREPARLARDFAVAYRADDATLTQLRALGWLVVRRPIPVLAELLATRRGGERLMRLAPRVRRLVGHGVRVLAVADESCVPEARRLARLARLDWRRPDGLGPEDPGRL